MTKPFRFEGANRMKQAEAGIANLTDKVDSMIIIPNDRLKFVTDQKITFANAFGIADDVLKQAVSSISELVGYSENVIINLDFADVSAIMRNAGQAHMGVGSATGRDKAEQAAQAAVSSPLLETSINGATGVLINIAGSHDLGLDDVETAANIVMEAANPDANIIQAQLLFLESADPDKDIQIYINSPGGSVSAGLGIYDTMQLVNPDVATIDPETGKITAVGVGTATLTVTTQNNKKGTCVVNVLPAPESVSVAQREISFFFSESEICPRTRF